MYLRNNPALRYIDDNPQDENQSILKAINLEYSLEGLTLKLKLQYCGHLMQRANSLEKTLKQGKIEGRRRRGWQRMRWLDGITNSMDNEFEQASRGGEGQGSHMCCSPWGSQSPAWLSDWTTISILTKVAWASQHHSFWFHTPREFLGGILNQLQNPAGRERQKEDSLCRWGGGRFNKQVTSLKGWS